MWSTCQGSREPWHRRCSPTAMNGMPSWMLLLDIVGLGTAQCWLGESYYFSCQQRTSCGQPTPVLSYPRFWLGQTMSNPMLAWFSSIFNLSAGKSTILVVPILFVASEDGEVESPFLALFNPHFYLAMSCYPPMFVSKVWNFCRFKP